MAWKEERFSFYKPWQNAVTESFNGKFRDEASNGFVRVPKRRSLSRRGGATTTKYVRIQAPAISRRTSSRLEQQNQRPATQRAGTLR